MHVAGILGSFADPLALIRPDLRQNVQFCMSLYSTRVVGMLLI